MEGKAEAVGWGEELQDGTDQTELGSKRVHSYVRS
jgi:hypothetical protein